MSSNKRKYSLGQAWDREEEKLCRAVKRLHTTSDTQEVTTESSEDDAGSPVYHPAAGDQPFQQEGGSPSHGLAGNGPCYDLSDSVPMQNGSSAASPAHAQHRPAFQSSSASASPPARMSLGKSRGKQSREDTPDPRAVPSQTCNTSPAEGSLRQYPGSQPSSRRGRRPASAAATEVSGAPGQSQLALQPGSASINPEATQDSMPMHAVQARIPEHVQAAQDHSSESGQPEQPHAASKWTLKFKPEPPILSAASGAAAVPASQLPQQPAGQMGTAMGPASVKDMSQAQATEADVVELPARLQHVQLSGGADSTGLGDIQEPLTPGRTERSTGTAADQGSALEQAQSSYDSLYEEANNLLKNLHFQRLLRHGPESPEPMEKSTLGTS